MAYTPRSMAGMNNMTAEIAAADAPQYGDIRLFTVGQGTVSKTPLNQLATTYHNWTAASAAVLGGTAWKEFSAVCWLTGREIHDALGVPVGLISSNWGGTSIQVWMPPEANKQCKGTGSGDRHNAMIHPYTVGPMQMAGVLWYQGESNNGQVSARAHHVAAAGQEYHPCMRATETVGWNCVLRAATTRAPGRPSSPRGASSSRRAHSGWDSSRSAATSTVARPDPTRPLMFAKPS